MSKRYRIEVEKAQQLTQEVQQEEDKMKLQKERIFGAIIWRRIFEGIKIQDLKPNLYEETLDMIEKFYLSEAVVFKSSNILKDPISVKSFRDKLLFNMKNQCSIVAVDEANEERLVGVLLLKAINKCDYGRVFSRTQLLDGASYQSIQNFFNHINRKVDIFEHYQCDTYLRYYLLCIQPDYRGKGIGFQLMEAALTVAKHLNINIMMGIFGNHHLQRLARKIGMETLYEQEYVSWKDKMGELQFCDPGAGNYASALMAGEVDKSLQDNLERLSKASLANDEPPVYLTRAGKRKSHRSRIKLM